MHHLSLLVIAPDSPTRAAPSPATPLPRLKPGEAVELVAQPEADPDQLTIQVITEHGAAIGQLTSERSHWIKRVMARHQVRAVYQEEAAHGAVIRVAFDGEQPTVPATRH